MHKSIEKIKPSKKEGREIKEQIDEVLKNIRIKDAKAVVGGSFAKNTWLKNDCDVDIFVKFNYKKYKGKSVQLSDILINNIKKLKAERLHGSRDYFQVKKNNLVFEIIPILDIKNSEDAMNITDVSPLHAKWVKKHRKDDEIRLTKAFAKAQNVYGAESYIQGFSGYVLEILTIHYGSFLKLIKNASKWKKQTIIDPENLLKNPLVELNTAKLNSPLILVDPVDKRRNAGAAISHEKYNKFIKACKNYLENPGEKFFIPKPEVIPKNALIIEFSAENKKDSVRGKCYSMFNKLKKHFILEGYEIKKSGFILDNKIKVWFLLKKDKLSSSVEYKGPSTKDKKNSMRFKKKHKRTYTKNGIIYAKERRQHKNAREFLISLIKKYGLMEWKIH